MDSCPWKAIVDPASGNTYYAHAQTGETTWTRPAEMESAAQVALPALQTPSKRPPPPLPAGVATPTSSSPSASGASALHAAEGAAFSSPPAAAAAASADSAATAPVVDIAGTSWSKVLDAASGKYYYANRVTFEVAWEEPAEIGAALLAAQMARQQLSASTPLQRLVVPEEGETISLSASVPADASATASPSSSASAPPARGTGHHPHRSSINLYAAPVQDFGIEHEFHRVLDAASNNFYYVHKQTSAVQWNVPESWARVQALESQLLLGGAEAERRASLSGGSHHTASKSWSLPAEIAPAAGAAAPVRPATMRASAVPPPLPQPQAPAPGGDAFSSPQPPPPQRKASLSGRAPPPLPAGMPPASPASKTGSRLPPPPPPSYLSPQHGSHSHTESGSFATPGSQHAGGEHRHSISGSTGAGGLYSPTSPFMSPVSTPKVGGGSSSAPPPPVAPGPPPAPTLFSNPMAGPPGGSQQLGPDGRPVLLMASIKNEIHNFGLKSFASAHFRTFKKRTGIVARTVIDVNELLSWQREVISKSLLTSTKKYSSDAVALFKKVLAFMGDAPEASKKNPAILAAEIVAIGVKNAPMRDEIYCQLCKQTKLNPEPLSTAAGWKLMALCCSNFAPTLAFQQTLMDYFVDNFAGAHAAGSSSSSSGTGTGSFSSSLGGAGSGGGGAALGAECTPAILSRYCNWKVGATISHGADEKLTLSAVDDMCARGVRSHQVLFPGSLDYIVHLQQAERNATSTTVPEIMVRMCEAIRAAGGFSSKGIFRIAAQREHVQSARARIEAGRWEVPADQSADPHTPADVLKHWLRELQTPVIPMNMYEQALRICDSEADAVALADNLSPVHFAAIDYLLTYLAELSTHEKITAMSPDNLAIVFSQDLLRTDEKDPVVLYKNSAKEKAFVRTLITAWRNKLHPHADQ